MSARIRLGVNIDHVATIRNARGGAHPDPLRAANIAAAAGADLITAHLREDRRHITDDDMAALRDTLSLPLNMEIAPRDEMLAIALQQMPYACCLVPEKREEITTEAGLAAARLENSLAPVVRQLTQAGIHTALFVDPDPEDLRAASQMKADAVELHTGAFCNAATAKERAHQLERLREAAQLAASLGLEVHAGHGLDFSTAAALASIPQVCEVNIGHFLVGEAVFLGLANVIKAVRAQMDKARSEAV